MVPKRRSFVPTALGGLFVCGFLLFTQLFNAAFELPPQARNLSPFNTNSFAAEQIAPGTPSSFFGDSDVQRLGIWIALILVLGLVSRIGPANRLTARLWSAFLALPLRPYVVVLVFLQFALCLGLTHFVFERMPHVQDSIGQLFQARILAEWKLWATPFPWPGAFSFYSIVETDRWFSQHPPGLPLLLAPLVRLGAPWLLNPILGAACSLLIFRLARMLYDEAVARVALLLVLTSPFHAFMSASFMNHTATLFFLLATAVLLLRVGRSPSDPLAGFCLGFAAITRPLTALAVGGYTAVASARKLSAVRVAGIAAGAALPLAFLGWYNWRLTGSPFTFGYNLADPLFHRLGFHDEPQAYSPLAGVLKTNLLFKGLNLHLFGWPVASLWFVFLLFLRGAPERRDFLLLGAGLALPSLYFFYWFQDSCLGPRFIYETIPVWILLSARGIVRSGGGRLRPSAGAAALLAFGLAFAAIVIWPDRVKRYSDSYWGVDRRMVDTVERADLSDAIVLIDNSSCHPWYYGAGFWANSPGLDSNVVYVRDGGPEGLELLLQEFPGRDMHRYDCATGRLLAVSAAPASPAPP